MLKLMGKKLFTILHSKYADLRFEVEPFIYTSAQGLESHEDLKTQY